MKFSVHCQLLRMVPTYQQLLDDARLAAAEVVGRRGAAGAQRTGVVDQTQRRVGRRQRRSLDRRRRVLAVAGAVDGVGVERADGEVADGRRRAAAAAAATAAAATSAAASAAAAVAARAAVAGTIAVRIKEGLRAVRIALTCSINQSKGFNWI